MATKNPRITITVQPSLHAQLRRLSELTGNSQSSLVGELLDGAGPTLERVIKVLEIAQTAKDSIKGKLAAEMDAAQAKVEAQLGLALEAYEDMATPLLDMAESIDRRSRRRTQGRMRSTAHAAGDGSAGKGAPPRGERSPARALPTPLSNRGVRSDPQTREKQATMRVSGEVLRESYKHANPTKKLDRTTVKKGARK